MSAYVQTAWAEVLIDTIARLGVRDVVLSPGSRSTPFVAAALRHPKLQCHVVIDERSAAFFALGQARTTGRPSLLIATSGTAAAHYYPAVIEASLARLPMLVLSADRPLELHDCAAPQTIEQAHMFGSHVRAFFELGVAEDSAAALRGLRRRVAQAVSVASTDRGPVHINAKARKPLEPHPPRDDRDRAFEDLLQRVLAEPLSLVGSTEQLPSAETVSSMASLCRGVERGLIVCGPAPEDVSLAPAVLGLARKSGFVVLPEATSQVRWSLADSDGVGLADGFENVLSSPSMRRSLEPQIVIEVGRPPTSKAYAQWVAERPELPRIVISDLPWSDPHSTANMLVRADVVQTVRALSDALPGGKIAPSEWTERWRRANQAAWKAVDALLEADRAQLPTEGAVVRRLVDRLPEPSTLLVGNSLPIRHLDRYCPARSLGLGVQFQRGANGIDGLVSSALGAASVSKAPFTLLIGDVSFTHDVGGLASVPALEQALVVVVLDNAGGRIFEQLPIARDGDFQGPELEPWLTPPTTDLESIARAFGVRYAAPAGLAAFELALADAYAEPGLTLVHVRVERSGARRLAEAIADRLQEEEGHVE